MPRIHQFAPSVAVGDGVTGGVMLTQALLRELGHDSRVYCLYPPRSLPVFDYEQYRDQDSDLLLVHHSMGHDLEPWLTRRRGQQALVYHNITPAEFFATGSPEHHYATLGREQLARWVSRYPLAIADSAYNGDELKALGYDNIEVIPLVVGHERLLGLEPRKPPAAEQLAGQTFVLGVGRIAENKRQHLLLEALWHLKRFLGDEAPRLVISGSTTTAVYAQQLRARCSELGLNDDVLFAGKCSDAELRWYYENAAQLWHASAHEGFCVPLVEACAFGVPVVAIGSSTVPATLGAAGLALEASDPATFAAASAELTTSPALRDAVASGARDNLARFDRARLRQQLGAWVEQALAMGAR